MGNELEKVGMQSMDATLGQDQIKVEKQENPIFGCGIGDELFGMSAQEQPIIKNEENPE